MTEKNETIGDMPHAQKIMAKIKGNKCGLNISRIPPKTKDDFIALADKEFCSDYGFTLKFLMDDLIDPDIRILVDEIGVLKSKVAELEANSSVKNVEPETTDNTIKMCDGSKRNRRGNE